MESRNHIELRTFQEKDFAEVLQLFYNTVRNINSRDYTPEQISAWVLGVDEARMKKVLLAHTTLVATSNGKIAGFADMDESGYLDHLYVHRQHQRQGIATMLCDVLETETPAAVLSVHASITAKDFFSAARLSAASRTAGGTSGTAPDKLSHGKKKNIAFPLE